ncbi:MAG: radical SAM protein [Candidatus Helarchaeota archaeon]|nr:radical SAM protein [Candidatus Helarchaeota archaeon]
MYSLDLCITDKCNQHCPHCYVNPRNLMEDLSTEQILNLLTECAEKGAQNFHVFGGEPFLRDDLEEIFSHAYDLNYTLSIATNATRLEQKDFEWVQKFNTFLGITLHGPKSFHDSFCKSDGSYEKAVSALKTALQMNLNVGVITCVTKLNLDKYLPWMQSLVKLGASTFFILYFSPLGRGEDRVDLQLSNIEWLHLYQTLNAYSLNSPIRVNLYFERSIIPKVSHLFSAPPSLLCALYAKSNCVVDANGDVYPCILFLRNPDFRLGNFKMNSLHKIWSRFNPKTIIEAVKRSDSCINCQYITSCSGGCPVYYRAGLDFRCDEKNIPLCPLFTELL